METYDVKLPDTELSAVKSQKSAQVDAVASDILTKYHPIMKETHAPLCVTGDGNCLFRAVSLALYGTENYHVIIRTLAAIELIENRRQYDYEHEQFVDHFNDERLVF